MKKLFLFAAAAAMVLSVSCSETLDGGDKASITVKIAGPSSETRNPEAPAADLAPLIDESGTHYVYVISGGTVVYSEALTATPGTPQELADGEKRFDQNSSVYILANIPENVTGGDPASYGTMTAISEAVSAISYSAGVNTDYEHPAMGNSTGTATAIGTADVNGVATVAITLTPLFSRVELQGIQGGEWVKSFTVKGVYLDDYHSSFTMTGAGSVLHSLGQVTSIPAGQFGDQITTGGEWTAGANPVTAGEDQVWAYHVGAGSLVRIIVALDDVILYEGKVVDEVEVPDTDKEMDPVNGKFVTVTGYSQSLASFARGYIYSVNPITFNEVGEINDDMVAITANVTIRNWVKETLDPVNQ